MSSETRAPAESYHSAHLTADPNRAAVWRVITEYLAGWVPPQAHVLEIGAGYCDWINAVRAARRVAVDQWPGMASHAAPGVETVVADAASALPALGPATFDVVLASNVLEHFDPDTASKVVGDIAGVLRPGGRILIVQPNFRYAWRRYFDDYTHRSVFTHVSLPALLRAHRLLIDVVQPRFLPYSMRGAGSLARPWLVRAYLRSPVKPMAGQMLVIAHRS